MNHFLIKLLFLSIVLISCNKNQKNDNALPRNKIFRTAWCANNPVFYLDSICFAINYYNTIIKPQNNEKNGVLEQDLKYFRNAHPKSFYQNSFLVANNFIMRTLKFDDSIDMFNKDVQYTIYEYDKNSYCTYIKIVQNYDSNYSMARAVYLIWPKSNFVTIDGLKYYKREINEDTEYIKTNLPKEIINKLYPNFKGKYIYEYYKQILIDYKYPIDSDEFYKHIEFIK